MTKVFLTRWNPLNVLFLWHQPAPQEANMFTLLADAMFTATLARRGSKIPEHLKTHADRHVPKGRRRPGDQTLDPTSYRDLW